MRKIVIASNNRHKVDEIKAVVADKIELLTLADIGCTDEIPETADTLDGNALQKARWVYERYGYACFADDTGLEVDALNGKPGVYSARFSADEAPNVPPGQRAAFNISKLLRLLNGVKNRNAAFRTVICFIGHNGETSFFEGKIEGKIIDELKGEGGFGYDPVFVPNGYTFTFSEMPAELKNKISHRAIATNKLIEYLIGK